MPERILLVDDDPDILMPVGLRLHKAGFDVQTAQNGKEALEAAFRQRFDLILLDIMMPEMDGYETCARLQENEDTAYIPVIFVTALGEERDKSKAFSVGAVDYIVKPFEEAELLRKARLHVKTRNLWKKLHDKAPEDNNDKHVSSFTRFKARIDKQMDLLSNAKEMLAKTMSSEIYTTGKSLGITKEQMAKYIADFLKIEHIQIIEPGEIKLGILPTTFCRANHVAVIQQEKNRRLLVLANPFNHELIDLIRNTITDGNAYDLAVTEPGTLISLLENRPQQTLSDLKARLRETYQRRDEEIVRVTEEATEESAPIIMLVNKLIETAHEKRASDIHIEPMENEVVIRYRIDGELRIMQRIRPRSLARPLASRIKIMSNLDIAEHRLPQDGRIGFQAYTDTDMDFDLRVSTSPCRFGEKVVLRILDKQRSILPMDQLGFSSKELALYRETISTPYGLILHVGPTGSGKSLALYAALNEIQHPGINIQTAEDPIEYTLPGITQLQIHPDIGLTFKRALRSFLRQDPDIILVGEIRDRETADITVEAALTGHLVFSTMHTNDAASTLMRFIEMGVDPFMISASLVAICAQRLLRRLCPVCKEPYTPSNKEKQLLGIPEDEDLTLHKAGQCPECDETGYQGRIGIYELLVPNKDLRKNMNDKGVNIEELKHCAVQDCEMTTLYQDATKKVRQGITSLAEILSNVRQDDEDA